MCVCTKWRHLQSLLFLYSIPNLTSSAFQICSKSWWVRNQSSLVSWASEIFIRALMNNCGSEIYPCLGSHSYFSVTKLPRILVNSEESLLVYGGKQYWILLYLIFCFYMSKKDKTLWWKDYWSKTQAIYVGMSNGLPYLINGHANIATSIRWELDPLCRSHYSCWLTF